MSAAGGQGRVARRAAARGVDTTAPHDDKDTRRRQKKPPSLVEEGCSVSVPVQHSVADCGYDLVVVPQIAAI
jgi:hypothetical protein